MLLALGVALLASVVPYTLEFAAMRRAPRRVFGILLSLDPALATLAGWLLLGQRSSPVAIAAVGVVITASVGSTLLASPESKILNSFAPNGPGRLRHAHDRCPVSRPLRRAAVATINQTLWRCRFGP